MPRLVITNIDYLVTVDPSRRIIRNGALAIQHDRIVAVGKSNEFPPNPGDDVIDGRGKLALPGIFDTHVHNAQQLGGSCGDEGYSGPERLFRRLWPVEAHMDKGDALCAGTALPAWGDPSGAHVLCGSRQLFRRRDGTGRQ